ncbi:STAS domain-containing protein [Streptomyces sp. H27-C3]|uniref:STAS domain-containing protein n=1 Tax=Streptomyces sp. H27-C3 TaxID=3046305 RepID=UPI0024B9CBBE|nr:STAS domain-containing protein [Streptomyces sp. H27-C3]MDJ0463483.1 STAS domain-containing protein [Streptomyces sp. H27-C3]
MGVDEITFFLRDRTIGAVLVIELHGELDIWATVVLCERAEAICDRSRPDVVVDLRPATFLDAGGLRLLLRIRAQVARRRGSLRLVRPIPKVWRVLWMTGLDQAFTVIDVLEGQPIVSAEAVHRGDHGLSA